MIKVKSAEFGSESLDIFKQWISEEWGNVDLLSDFEKEILLPKPLLAFNKGNLVGGLSFIYYKHPYNSENVIWINTVYIDLNSRRQGFASILIEHAEEIVLQGVQKELFVYTSKPNLYLKLDWEVLNKDNDNFVLKKLLIHNS